MDEPKSLDLFVFTGEPSGDLLGARVLANLSKEISAAGCLGPALRKLPIKELYPMEDFQVVGFTQVLLFGLKMLRYATKIKDHILRLNPKVVLLIDYAEFSGILAKKLKKAGYKGKIIKLVCPTIWAWRRGRKQHIEKYFNHLFCIFPFEAALFDDSPLDATYIGHPLKNQLDKMNERKSPSKIISIFPGSRTNEVKASLPLFLKALKETTGFTLKICVASPKLEPIIQNILVREGLDAELVPSKDRYTLMQASTLALTKFGTITLELALLQTPAICALPIPWFERVIAQHVFKIFLPHYSLPNILSHKRIFPEYVGQFATKENIDKEIRHLLTSELARETMKSECLLVKDILGDKNPERIVFQKIKELLQ